MGCSQPFPLSLFQLLFNGALIYMAHQNTATVYLKVFLIIYFNLVRYPSYMWKFVSSVLRLGETLRSALQSGDMVSVICFRA